MKIRNGFVSNSSSASFIVKFESNNTFEEIKKVLNDSCKVHYSDGLYNYKFITQLDEVYVINLSTSMFNDWYDISVWPFVRMLSENKVAGYNLLSLRKTYDEHEDCDTECEFDSKCWQEQFKHLQEEESPQKEYDQMYLEFLSTLSNKE